MTSLWIELDMTPEGRCKEVFMEQQMVHYTLTGAADWPMLAAVGGVSFLVLQAAVIVLIAVIYKALPKQKDLQDMKNAMHLDVKELAARFETILDKYMDKELTARVKKEDDILQSCRDNRTVCQARYDRLFEQLKGNVAP
jgi:hypothetical protein